MPIVTSKQLLTISKRLLKAAGASDEEASIVGGFLVKANLAGVDSHGVLPNLTYYIEGLRAGVIKPGAKFEIAKETPSAALVNGNWGFGQVICSKAMQLAIDKARKTGVGVVGIYNCNHIGRLADYTSMALQHDMIGFIAVNSNPCVAPYGGRKGLLSTNPLSYGIPAGEEKPIVTDFATSMAAEGRIRSALYKEQELPPGWIADSEGRPSTNPADLYEAPLPPDQIKIAGAILPFGGYKGYGLSLVVEILAGALTGSGCSEEIASGLTNGVVMIVLNIEQFTSLEAFKRRVDNLVRSIKSSPKAQG